ncbi:tripartite tricarboxylate transporter substrate binding protein [Limnohabitans sp. 2KL-51]|uniref:Bug family tripartite tricarboxylate transporter substrate binding protein n=1 Tax=Limnohabitans sp. 2KL-51 TaxID=1977911 RepID=UPI001304B96D|nr:tripartite tricarboxylate transporter substrate binding protein [Limnohabitans sp. 2KL-51]
MVPYPPGASTDAVGRIVGQKLSANIGQTVIVDNRAGASGNIGTEFVSRSAPDGYTFVMGTDATHASNSFLTANPTFDPIKDFTPLAIVAMNPIALVVHPSVPAKDLNELVAWLKANPGKGGFGSSGTGSPHHLAGELLKARTGAPLIHVPYRGGGPALNDLMGGQISLLFASAITVVPHIQSGKVKAIALTSAKRSGILPNVPTMGESLDGFEMPSWLAFFGPAKMPDAVTRRLSDELVKVLSDPDVRTRLTAAGMDVVAGGQAELTELQRREYQSRGKLIRDANIKGE